MGKKSGKKSAKNTASEPQNSDVLIRLAEDAMSSCDFVRADELFSRAALLSPANPSVCEAFGHFCLQNGDVDKAFDLFKKCVELEPCKSGSAWLALAQLQAGPESLASYNRGIEFLQSKMVLSPEVWCCRYLLSFMISSVRRKSHVLFSSWVPRIALLLSFISRIYGTV
jgi:tetratricopeptide (TPR) repeat protein